MCTKNEIFQGTGFHDDSYSKRVRIQVPIEIKLREGERYTFHLAQVQFGKRYTNSGQSARCMSGVRSRGCQKGRTSKTETFAIIIRLSRDIKR